MSDRDGQTLFIFDGYEGESLFTKPFVNSSRIHQHNLELDKRALELVPPGDERSYVLVSALVVENSIGRFLQAWLPGYEKLSGNRDFITSSMKMDLVSASRLIPPHIMVCCNVIRRVRNAFAHNLEIDTLDKLDQSHKDILRNTYEAVYNRSRQSGAQTAKGKTVRQLFDGVYFISLGITHYEENITVLREAIQSEEFLDMLYLTSKTRAKQWETEMISGGPVAVEFRGNTKIEKFRGGVTRVSSVNQEATEPDKHEPTSNQ
ncbi:MAG TPA: hypothetical protein VEX13_00230 [Chloroflexia bacterium]|nr:hypothetical protein [Chloroflexia bacterium]